MSEPGGVPDPGFALASTVNWMHALKILLADRPVDFTNAVQFYSRVQKANLSPQEENTVFEQLLFSLHQLSALSAMKGTPRKSDLARVASVAWYYGVYAATGAMVTAQAKTVQHNHTQTANVCDRQLAAQNLLIYPFSPRLSTLLKADIEAEIAGYRAGNNFVLTSPATNPSDARGACCAYLSGNAEWWKWKFEQVVRGSSEFKLLGVSNFKTKLARELRDKLLVKKSVCFLHQAIRYRGKANYREALYLAHGTATEAMLTKYIDDLTDVLLGFVAMAGAFCSRRLGATLWLEFVSDLERYRSFSMAPSNVWS